MTATVIPEVLHKDQKVKIKPHSRRGQTQYIEKLVLAEELNRSRTMLSQWEELLITKSPDFRRYYTPGHPWNDFQAFCIELIHEWRKGIASRKVPPNAYAEFIDENTQLFTLENYKNVLQQHCQANRSRASDSVENQPQAIN